MNAAAWWHDTRAVYLDNATSRRDYRVQLRGNKSVVLFGTYLALLIGIAMLVYMNTVKTDEQEVVQAQQSLRSFYLMVTFLLGALVSLVAPALTATTIVTERQRKSLDLVFSAPVTPRYFLVGKMMSSFRYTWMLLIIALPVTAVCVVLGGASWSDVLITYALLSFQALIMTSIGLLLSTVATKPVSAILWSYAASIVYLLATGALAASTIAGSSPWSGAPKTDQPFFGALNPFFNQVAVSTVTHVFGHLVPNWILVGIFAVLISKICLLGAGILLSPRPEREIVSLRLHALVYTCAFLLYGVLSYSGAATGSYAITPGTTSVVSSGLTPHNAGVFFFLVVSPLFIVLPFLSCFGVDGERRFWPDGFFSLRHIFDGRPSGGLPYLLTFITLSGICFGAGAGLVGSGFTKPGPTATPAFSTGAFAPWLFFTLAFWTAFWAIGRLTSAFFAGLKTARVMQFASFLFFVVLPMPFLSALSGTGPESDVAPIWDFFILRSIFLQPPGAEITATIWAVGLLLLAIVVTAVAETMTRRKMARLQTNYHVELAQS